MIINHIHSQKRLATLGKSSQNFRISKLERHGYLGESLICELEAETAS